MTLSRSRVPNKAPPHQGGGGKGAAGGSQLNDIKVRARPRSDQVAYSNHNAKRFSVQTLTTASCFGGGGGGGKHNSNSKKQQSKKSSPEQKGAAAAKAEQEMLKMDMIEEFMDKEFRASDHLLPS